MKFTGRWEFLESNRFWAVVINAFTLYAQQKGWVGQAELTLVTAIAAPFIIIRTTDRIAEHRSVQLIDVDPPSEE